MDMLSNPVAPEANLTRPKIICLTPVKNEGWILDTFLRCASVWADHIIVADQMSTDASREIASRFEKAILVDNDSPTFNEPERVQLLLREARKIPGPKILIALDADEILAGELNWLRSPEFLSTAPGTRITFEWVNVEPTCKRFWNPNPPMCWGFVDDGSPHSGPRIHSGRVPEPEGAPVLFVKQLRVLHLQYIDWERMKSKHRWYQCYERVQYPQKRPLAIYRTYHHMDRQEGREMEAITDDSLSAYATLGIDPFAHVKEDVYRWDREVAAMVRQHGFELFRHIDIWDKDWSGVDAEFGRDMKSRHTRFGGLLFAYLRRTQSSARRLHVKLLDRAISIVLRIGAGRKVQA